MRVEIRGGATAADALCVSSIEVARAVGNAASDKDCRLTIPDSFAAYVADGRRCVRWLKSERLDGCLTGRPGATVITLVVLVQRSLRCRPCPDGARAGTGVVLLRARSGLRSLCCILTGAASVCACPVLAGSGRPAEVERERLLACPRRSVRQRGRGSWMFCDAGKLGVGTFDGCNDRVKIRGGVGLVRDEVIRVNERVCNGASFMNDLARCDRA